MRTPSNKRNQKLGDDISDLTAGGEAGSPGLQALEASETGTKVNTVHEKAQLNLVL